MFIYFLLLGIILLVIMGLIRFLFIILRRRRVEAIKEKFIEKVSLPTFTKIIAWIEILIGGLGTGGIILIFIIFPPAPAGAGIIFLCLPLIFIFISGLLIRRKKKIGW